MTIKEIKQLQNGDEVYWRDPFAFKYEEDYSRHIIIQDIEFYNDVVRIWGQDDSYLECYPDDLERDKNDIKTS